MDSEFDFEKILSNLNEKLPKETDSGFCSTGPSISAGTSAGTIFSNSGFPTINIGDFIQDMSGAAGLTTNHSGNYGSSSSSFPILYPSTVYKVSASVGSGTYSAGSTLGAEIPFPEDSRVVEALGEEIRAGDIVMSSKMSSSGYYAKSWLGETAGELLPCLVWKICCYKNSLEELSTEIYLHYFGKDANGDYCGEPLSYSICRFSNSIFAFDDLIKVSQPEYHMHLPKFSKVMQQRFSFLEDDAAYIDKYSFKVILPSYELKVSEADNSSAIEAHRLNSGSEISMKDYFTSSQFIIPETESEK